jgi:large subunit ribosomal protein L23
MADITDIKSVVYTEKAHAHEGNVLVLKTSPRVTKFQLRTIFKEYFGVEPLRINVLNQKGKVKKFKGYIGKRDDFKKFYVKIPDGTNIESLSV